MGREVVAGIETGGTKILARIRSLEGQVVEEGRWQTGSADQAVSDLQPFLSDLPSDCRLVAIGIAAFGPLIVEPVSTDYGRMLATPKPGWADSNLRAQLEERLGVPVAVDTDVNAAAIAEQRFGAGQGLPNVAYVTVGTGIGAGLAIEGRSLKGALHPEAGHLSIIRLPGDDFTSVCSFHPHCAEGLASGPAVRRRLGEGRDLADDPATIELVADYLGQLGAALVMAWSPHRIVWGGGVIGAAQLVPYIERRLAAALGAYGVGPAVMQPGFCAAATLENAGLEGALLMASNLAR
ncbi:MAG: ROK family protein [Pseudomonadota bacterium]|nr:ROK family protein [Pseudomonadota bacterium]